MRGSNGNKKVMVSEKVVLSLVRDSLTCKHEREGVRKNGLNSITATACKISGLKSVHI